MLVALDDGHAEVVLSFTVCAFSVSWSSEGDLFWALAHVSKRAQLIQIITRVS